ncbi:uncharacterized protein BDZ99DRAFT_467559 [Mytilinidion resinicola]|uniref:Uncharacterized protein n=1 Tax=Mytilinidion resinicola TaxID=574789 RepID=A0A6A6Y8E9_9PEZI|nr:uncharacterized protein BDZ99DRAFT_467559 [Mytilinidion resinicola]KAF2804244.1 hypothetical protein BDZ99DRAFT_467559 [Mytilinidion resinicola]
MTASDKEFFSSPGEPPPSNSVEAAMDYWYAWGSWGERAERGEVPRAALGGCLEQRQFTMSHEEGLIDYSDDELQQTALPAWEKVTDICLMGLGASSFLGL